MKGELWRLVSVVASWLSGSVVYGSFSQTPWVRIPQLPFFFSSFVHIMIENDNILVHGRSLDNDTLPFSKINPRSSTGAEK